MNQKPFRFGLAAGRGNSRTAWRDKARKVEDLGYDILLVPDHVTTDLAPITALAVAAEATRTLRIGSFVFCNDFRHPALLAREAATLDLLSEGRFELGLGAGYELKDYTQTGIPFDAPGLRVSRLEETLLITRQFFTEEVINFSGRHYTITGLRCSPRPAQQPYPPIFLGGSGKRLLSIGARLANSLGIGFQSITDAQGKFLPTAPEEIEEKITWIRQAAGERFEQLELGYTLFSVQVTNQRVHVPLNFHTMIGTQEQIIDELLERRARFGLTYVQVTEQSLDFFAPIVARLSGKIRL
ncbi:TIGR03621 family F420-dependent LLM class oxidoreductase [Dictyobacter formicarum]|uniref:LLM class F420-dependent oxidoreductase n=1 Tax=Dictyobacter formicarum TaxID=2778368 RepID=A0ABQ3V7Q7_9CHLR|nr:TIGR03621 family F420-dependent LLM class oxidoreductase [Dictyobacter formicarum]GHO82172.1 LLM class F420-dependent oxidoreductase [Dictyobacter formicarum]